MNQVAEEDKNYKISSDSPFVKISQQIQEEIKVKKSVKENGIKLKSSKPIKRVLRIIPGKEKFGRELERNR